MSLLRRGLLLLLLLIPFVPRGSSLSAQIGQPSLPVAEVPTARPRLLLTQDYIEHILIPRAEANTPSWAALMAYVDSDQPESDMQHAPQQVSRSLAVAHLVTGNPGYANRAQIALLQMVNQLESHPAMTGNAHFDAEFLDLVAGIAVAYDWLYASLTPTDRNALTNILLRAADLLDDPSRGIDTAYLPADDGTFRFAAFDHWGSRVAWAAAATGIALLGEDPAAPQHIDYARALLTGWIIPALDDLSGGAWAEGPTFGFVSGWANIQTAAAFWTAFGENYFDGTDWWYDRLAYDMFLSYPEVQHVGNDPSDAPFWGYPSIIGNSERYSEAALLGRAQDSLLATIFAGTEHAAWMNWFLKQGTAAEGVPSLQGYMAVEEFLWHDDEIAGFAPPWLVWFTSRTGHVFLRSGWDESATYISFNAGGHFARNQFYDAGNLTIWRSGDLAVRSGVFSGQDDHAANYYGRTVAANTLLICDLSENFDGILPNSQREAWLNDCGQRSTAPGTPTAINSYFLAENRASYETSTILRFAVEGSMNYFRADLTAAYNSTAYTTPGNRPKVTEVMREFVYLRPGTLIVHDRVSPTDPNAVIFNLIHATNPPAQAGLGFRISAGEGSLYVHQLAPQISVEVIEGFRVAGESLPPGTNAYEDEPYGAYRIQFVPAEARDTQYFLTVLVADDISSTSIPAMQYIIGDGTYGVTVDDWQVMFDDDPGNITRTGFNVPSGVVNVLMTGLEPFGQYRLTLANGTRADVTADDAGTLFVFVEQSGDISLRIR